MPRRATTRVVVRPPPEDPYKRFFWLSLATAIAVTVGGIGSYFAMWRDNAAAVAIGQTERKTLASDIAQLKADQPRLAEMGRTLAEASTKIDLMMASVSELRSQVSIFGSDRYTTSQASADKVGYSKMISDMVQALTGRIERLEEGERQMSEFRARIEERVKAVEKPADKAKE